jgi:hypothetical protein
MLARAAAVEGHWAQGFAVAAGQGTLLRCCNCSRTGLRTGLGTQRTAESRWLSLYAVKERQLRKPATLC